MQRKKNTLTGILFTQARRPLLFIKEKQSTIFHIIRMAILSFFSLQFLTVVIIVVGATIRDRRKGRKPRSFPHTIELDEVTVSKNRLQLYCYGHDLYNAMFEAIDNAKENIFIESYIWKDDEAGQAFQTHLARKAKDGVQVYVIFDSIGNLVVPHAFKASFDPAIHLMEYQAFRSILNVIDPRHYSLDHRKLLIVDGEISFIGGYNIGSLYEKSWRDTHLRIIGPASADIAHTFIDFWNRFCRKDQRIESYYPRKFDAQINLHENDALQLAFPIRDMYIEALRRAEHHIYLSNAYFIPDHILLSELQKAARRGVDVRILVPLNSNHVLADWISRGNFSTCLDAGIHMLGYKPAMLHAKTCTIDGIWSTLGTANMDRLSSIGNYEINVEIYSEDFAVQMEKLFAYDTHDIVTFTAEDWNHRPWYIKLSERILNSLRYVM